MKGEITKKILDWMQSLENVVSDQLPLFIQEIATYGFWSSLIYAIMGFSLIILCGMGVRWGDRLCKTGDEDPVGIILFFSIIAGILGLVIFLDNIGSVVKAKFAPRLYVMERIMK